jgi:hypothetical protein
VDLDLHVVDHLDVRADRRAVLHVGDRIAVEQVVVADRDAAAERDARRFGLILHPVHVRIAGVGDGRHGVAGEKSHPADARQRFERLAVEDVAR